MSVLRILLGDQLSDEIAALADLDATRDTVLMMEVAEEGTYVPHHKQKLVLVLSAMRHFAHRLRERGVRVEYVELDDPGNSGIPRYEQEKLNAMAAERAEAGFQLGFHAIGDEANTFALNAYSAAEQVAAPAVTPASPAHPDAGGSAGGTAEGPATRSGPRRGYPRRSRPCTGAAGAPR